MERKSWGFNQLYTVVFYEGGREKGEWKESKSFTSQSDAFKHQREINDGGRAAYVYDRYQLEINGMPPDPPSKWDFEKLKWKDGTSEGQTPFHSNHTNNSEPRAVPAEETALFYRNDGKQAEMGFVGYLRGDFGNNGDVFWSTWFDGCPELKTREFKNELDTVINRLRSKGMLENRSVLLNYCYAHPETKLKSDRNDDYGFKIDTDNYSYYIRNITTKGDYDFYVFCYNRPMLEEYLGAAQGRPDDSQGMTMGGM